MRYYFTFTDLTGEEIAKNLIHTLKLHRLEVKNVVGQRYDGAAFMSGCVNGVQAITKESAPLATYIHCSAHVLNLVLITANTVPKIRNMFGTVKEITNFITESAK
jgi:hypothetical protein